MSMGPGPWEEDVDIFISVGDKGICGKHGCELEIDVVQLVDPETGEPDGSESVLFCPQCEQEPGHPPIYSDSRVVCIKHRRRSDEQVMIDEYDPELDAMGVGIGYCCPICLDEYRATLPQPQSDPDIPF